MKETTNLGYLNTNLHLFSDCTCNVTLIGNGVCNDEANNPGCFYDGGDCCININMDHCSECTCHYQENCIAGFTPSVVGVGFCDDETNNADCIYDGGDCCGSCVVTDHCSQCICLGGADTTNVLVGDGFCNDETNNFNCHYDFGDCCGYNVNSEHCTECTCFMEEMCVAGVHPLVGNGFCNDNTNVIECDYDGGDCCVNVNTDSCSECNCLGGVIISPGFPENYENNLDLTWLIQVPLGQKIETNFLSFHLESHAICR